MPAAHSNPSAPPQLPGWADDLFACIDARDAQGFVDFLTDDATFCFGNAPAATGKPAIAEAVAGFFTTIAALRHQVTLVVPGPDVLVCCGDVTYTRHDGTHVTLPFADTFCLRAGKISDYRIYMDIGPLYAVA